MQEVLPLIGGMPMDTGNLSLLFKEICGGFFVFPGTTPP
jgi:hypothetical protein